MVTEADVLDNVSDISEGDIPDLPETEESVEAVKEEVVVAAPVASRKSFMLFNIIKILLVLGFEYSWKNGKIKTIV